jgi:predicted site-specific integrase-resolvase
LRTKREPYRGSVDALPLVLQVEHVAEVLGIAKRSAYRHVRSGSCGTYTEVGGVIRVRRDVFLKALEGKKR